MKISRENKRRLAELTVLTVIVILLQVVGKTIRIGEFSISLILLPVVVGAVLCGPGGGAWLGFVFGTVLMLTGETDAFYTVSPLPTIIATAGRGALAGLASGLVYSAVGRKKEDLAIVLASITAPVVNTGLFLFFCLLFFFDIFETMMGPGNVLRGMVKAYVSTNFLIELALSMVLTPVLVRLAMRLENRSLPGDAPGSRNRRKLATRLTVTVVLLGILICMVSSGSGYRNVRSSMEKQYTDTAYRIAEAADSYLDTELLRSCGDALEAIRAGQKLPDDAAALADSREYGNTLRALGNLCEKMGADEILVSVPDTDRLTDGPSAGAEEEWLPLTCIFDCRPASGGSLSFGQGSAPDPVFASVIANALETRQRPEGDLITEGEGTDSTLAVHGIYDEDTGELLALVSVSVPMGALKSAVRHNITNSTVMMICIEVIFITLYFYYIAYRVIEPIRSISDEVSSFVESENRSGGSLGEIHTHDEIQQLAEDIVKMEKDIGTYIAHITAITAERERIGAELNVAARIQADMLPSRFPAFPGRTDFDIFASMDPAKEVGGDFYDFFLLDDDHLALVIADVSDKGVPAALFMVVAKTLMKNQASFTRSPKQILEAVNCQLCENNASRMFVTAWMCILEISTGKCVAANAGHEYPAIRRANGDFELMKDKHGFVLGGIQSTRYSEYEFQLEKGGSIFVYTDGVTEATNAAEELFGTDRMTDALNIDSGASPAEIIRNTRAVIDAFVGDAPQFDDITMLCVRRN